MRIISGIARGRTIFAPKGQTTRPTQDYVRESLFNILQNKVQDASVLDLFAGSGALALEAVSRGAKSAVLVDQSRQAIECIKRNVQACGFSEKVIVLQNDWRKATQRLQNDDYQFDMIFIDPPYKMTDYQQIADSLLSFDLFSKKSILIIEHRKNVDVDLETPFQLEDVRTYGDTVIHMYRIQTGRDTDA